MKIGLVDVDGHNFPNLALMKISAWHKSQGDCVEWCIPILHYDKVYVSKVFGDEYSTLDETIIQATEIIYGGTGFAISIVDGKEVYEKEKDKPLPDYLEHIYPDYSLYPQLTQNTAYGFLTRGCCNNCSFCIVSQKEGICSHKVSDLSEFWRGQKNIELMDANLLACNKHMELLQQLIDSGAKINFNQGLDARFINEKNVQLLKQIKTKCVHFAFDFMRNENQIINGLKLYKNVCQINERDAKVYMLTNFDTNIEQDMRRVNLIRDAGYEPDIRIYRKPTAPRILKDLQRWCNNRFIYQSCPDFMDYVPRSDGKTIKQLYFMEETI